MYKRGSSQLRKGRYSESGRVYLVTAVTRNRHRAFDDFASGRRLIRELLAEESRGDLNSLAFVVMPDHLHWLIQLNDNADLSVCVRRAKSISARMINAHKGFVGRFWQDGFHDRALRKDEDLASAARYVVANPLRAGLVKSLRHYPLWDAIWV